MRAAATITVMEPREKRCLLLELHQGKTSRNRHFERFCEPQALRVLRAHRRLRSLLHELSRSSTKVETRNGSGGGMEVISSNSVLRYRRRVVLESWEAEFLLAMAPPGSLPDAPGTPTP